MQHASATHRPRYADRRPIRSPLSQAVLSACLVIGAGAMVLPVHAQAPAQQGVQRFDIPAGPLDAALNRFAAQAGILLAIDGSLTAGQISSGLSDSYGVSDGLATLLRGRSLEVVRGADGSYLLRPVTMLPAAGAGTTGSTQLPTVNVTATAERPGTTEGTGSYTTRSTSTATKLNLSLRGTPQTVSVMTRQRIEDQGLDSVSRVLEQTPGLSVQNLGSERFNIYSRGYSIDSYQFDGIPTNLLIATQVSSQSLADTLIYDRVEVLRGASGLMTGAGDPSGTINLVRKRPTSTFKGQASVGIGSWDLYRSDIDLSGPINEAGSVRGRVIGAVQKNKSFMDGYQQDKQVFYGVIEADLSDTTLLTAGVDYQRNDPRGASGTGFPLFYRDGTQTNFSRSINPASTWSTNQQNALNMFATLEQKLPDGWSMKLAANRMRTTRDYSNAAASWDFPNRATGDGVRLYGGVGSTWQQQTGLDAMIQGPFELFGRKHELIAGFNTSTYDNRHRPELESGLEGRTVNIYSWNNQTAEPISQGLLYNGNTEIRQQGAYAAARFKPADGLSVITGARVSDYRYRYDLRYLPANFQRFNSSTRYQETGEVTPYAGVVYDLDDTHSVYASYTSIFKPQSVRDRNGVALKPRQGDNYEAGLKSEFWSGALSTSVAVFQSKQNNLAQVDPGQVIPGTTSSAYVAVQGAKTRGIDLEANGRLTRDWQVNASFSFSETEDAAGQRISTMAPANMLKLWTTYRLPGALNRLTVGGGLNWQSAIYFSARPGAIGRTVTARQDAYTVVNLMARYEFNDQLSATLNLNNLFDKQYLSALDTTFYSGYYGAPRNAMLTLKYQF